MARNLLFDALKEIKEQEEKKPKVIYLDEKDGKIKEKPLLDSAGSKRKPSLRNPIKEIHDSIFHY
jgi:hypothetical protein